MVLRLVSDPMLEKSNRTGPLADRQKESCYRQGLGFSFFSDFQLLGKRGIFKKFLGNFPDSRDSGNSGKFSREIFSSLIILTFFLIFSILDLIFNILLCCFDKLRLSFSIFSTN